MSKYTKLELQVMASTALSSRKRVGDDRWMWLVLRLSLALDLTPDQVEANIAKLANGEAV